MEKKEITVEDLNLLIPPAHFEPLVRTFRATIPAYGSQPFR